MGNGGLEKCPVGCDEEVIRKFQREKPQEKEGSRGGEIWKRLVRKLFVDLKREMEEGETTPFTFEEKPLPREKEGDFGK